MPTYEAGSILTFGAIGTKSITSTLSINHICGFLIKLFKEGHQVSLINVTRSGIAFLLSEKLPISENPRIKSFFSFFFFGKDTHVFPGILLLGIFVKF